MTKVLGFMVLDSGFVKMVKLVIALERHLRTKS